MPKVDVYDLTNERIGELELSDAVFGAEINEHLLYESVRHYLAGERSGTAKTKNRWEVAGSGKEAVAAERDRQGAHRSGASPLWRHGATTHGPSRETTLTG